MTRLKLLEGRLRADGGKICEGVGGVCGSGTAGKWLADEGEREEREAGVCVGRRDDLLGSLAVTEGPIRREQQRERWEQS